METRFTKTTENKTQIDLDEGEIEEIIEHWAKSKFSIRENTSVSIEIMCGQTARARVTLIDQFCSD